MIEKPFKLIGLMPIRNEEWCLGLSARVALTWVDELVILDHASHDRSPMVIEDLMNEYEGRIWKHREPDQDWQEMTHRQSMLVHARSENATHIALIDADEVLTGNIGPNVLRDHVRIMPGDRMLSLPGYNLRGSRTAYHLNGIWGSRWFSTAFKDRPGLKWEGIDFHAREPKGAEWVQYNPIMQGCGGVMHLWGVSERRLKAKHALYKMVERIRFPDKAIGVIDTMYSWSIKGDPNVAYYGTPDTWQYRAVPSEWWRPYEKWMHYLDTDLEPWQERECREMVKRHGSWAFDGLDLFGVV